jgi:hypothetical protein
MDGSIEKDGKIVIWKHNPDINIYKQDYKNWKHEAKKFMDTIRNEKTYEEFNKWLDSYK